MKKANVKKFLIPLPAQVKEIDLVRPGWEDKDKMVRNYERNQFELRLVQFREGGYRWVIPTLHIGNSRRGSIHQSSRTYAVQVPGGELCRVGSGPHVKECVQIYVRESRAAALEPLLKLREDGAAKAGQVRDRISSRRAQGQLMRAEGRSYWRWDT